MGGWTDPRTGLKVLEKAKYFAPRGILTRDPTALRLVTILSELFRFRDKMGKKRYFKTAMKEGE